MNNIRGSYASGFAPRDFRPKYPSLWEGRVFSADPALGPSGAILRDWSGKHNDVALTNFTLTNAWALKGGRYALIGDGATTYCLGSDSAMPSGAQPRTMCCWFNAAALPATGFTANSLISWGKPGNATGGANHQLSDLVIYNNSVNTVVAATQYGNVIQSALGLATNTTYFCAASFDGTTWSVYVTFGSANTEATIATGTMTTNTILFGELMLMARRDGDSSVAEWFNGWARDFAVYNRALSIKELNILSRSPGIAYEYDKPAPLMTYLVAVATPSVSPSTATIDQLATTTFSASNFTNGAVTWSSNNPGVATVNSSTGVVTGVAHGQATSQTATITATGVSNPSQTAAATVTVRAVSLSVSPTSTSIGTSATVQLTATVLGTANTAVTWSLQSGAGSVNSTGLYTAPASTTVAAVHVVSQADPANGHADSTITVSLTRTVTGEANFGVAYAGRSDIGWRILNSDGSVYSAPTLTGIVEQSLQGVAQGVYVVSDVAVPQSFLGILIIDAPPGSGLVPYFHVIRPYITDNTIQDIPLAPYGISGLTIGYQINNPDGTTSPSPGLPHTTAGVIEYGGLGAYGKPSTFNLSDNFVWLWDPAPGMGGGYTYSKSTDQPTATTLIQSLFISKRSVR